MVLGVLRTDCDDTLRRIREVKALTTILGRAVRDIEAGIVAELSRIIDLIPDPPLFDLRELANIITCPLTPQSFVTDAIALGIADIEAKTAAIPFPGKIPAQINLLGQFTIKETYRQTTLYQGVSGILGQIAGMIYAAYRQILILLDTEILKSAFRAVLNIIFKYLYELDRVLGGAAVFAVKLAVTSANAALVRGMCPEIYESGTLPYKSFVAEVSTFKFNGLMPELPTSMQPVAGLLLKLQAKLAGWASAQYILIA